MSTQKLSLHDLQLFSASTRSAFMFRRFGGGFNCRLLIRARIHIVSWRASVQSTSELANNGSFCDTLGYFMGQLNAIIMQSCFRKYCFLHVVGVCILQRWFEERADPAFPWAQLRTCGQNF